MISHRWILPNLSCPVIFNWFLLIISSIKYGRDAPPLKRYFYFKGIIFFVEAIMKPFTLGMSRRMNSWNTQAPVFTHHVLDGLYGGWLKSSSLHHHNIYTSCINGSSLCRPLYEYLALEPATPVIGWHYLPLSSKKGKRSKSVDC